MARHQNNVEMVVTRTGLKQYIHSSCWNNMIKEKRPYNGKLYMQRAYHLIGSFYIFERRTINESF